MVIYTITYPPAPYPSLVQPDYGSIEPGSPRYPGLIPYPSFVQQAPGCDMGLFCGVFLYWGLVGIRIVVE